MSIGEMIVWGLILAEIIHMVCAAVYHARKGD